MPSDHDASDLIRRQALTLLAVAQNGLTFAHDPFDRQRYTQVRRAAEELMTLIADGDIEQLRAAFSVDTGYMTPKVSVRGAIFNSEEELLLVQERADRLWTLPGGWCDVLESPAQAVAKEVREEAGLIVDVDKLVAVLDSDRHRPSRQPAPLFHVHKLFFLCRERGRVPADLTETSAIGWFALDRLPPLAPSVDEAQLRMMHTHWRHPELPTVFD
ncbi:NUDIX hydrolase [Mycolicibacterium smegmatis]|uniref:NUDIX hydrolase n=1 Tax=Mycolicibacterium smegmatis TaxID=1772 RepID=UPI0020A4108D|nr:NUDIX hydrolase [Mycolicibacterium smegmatis]MCP2622699.1 NUDIX hydrolase [Mycolicibacterium smegmatis]